MILVLLGDSVNHELFADEDACVGLIFDVEAVVNAMKKKYQAIFETRDVIFVEAKYVKVALLGSFLIY